MPYTTFARLTMMNSLKQGFAIGKQWLLSEKGVALVLMVMGATFIARGIHLFWVRPEPFGLVNLLGCGVGAFGAFFLLLITDYVFHHAPLVFIPWFIVLIYFAIIQPHFAVGLGLALWGIVISQLRS